MRVCCEDPREAGFEEERMQGFLHSNDPERKVRGLWVGGHPKRAKPSNMNPNEEGF
jgi:hypothetical protein